MKINFDHDFTEINITCKGLYNADRANSKDLGSMLNELSMVYSQAAKYNRGNGFEATAKDFEEKAHKLFLICKSLGAYDD